MLIFFFSDAEVVEELDRKKLSNEGESKLQSVRYAVVMSAAFRVSGNGAQALMCTFWVTGLYSILIASSP